MNRHPARHWALLATFSAGVLISCGSELTTGSSSGALMGGDAGSEDAATPYLPLPETEPPGSLPAPPGPGVSTIVERDFSSAPSRWTPEGRLLHAAMIQERRDRAVAPDYLAERFSFDKTTMLAIVARQGEDLGASEDGSKRFTRWTVARSLTNSPAPATFTLEEPAWDGSRAACEMVNAPGGRLDLLFLHRISDGIYRVARSASGELAAFPGTQDENEFHSNTGGIVDALLLQAELSL